MIRCEVYQKGKEDEEPIGQNFYFNTLPRVDDIIWLIVKIEDHPIKTKHMSCKVVYSAQWCSDSIEYNIGYLIVEVEEENYGLGGHK